MSDYVSTVKPKKSGSPLVPYRPAPPPVKWESPDDRRKTANHREVMKACRSIVAEVWERIPVSCAGLIKAGLPEAKVLLCNPIVEGEEAGILYMHAVPVPTADFRFTSAYRKAKIGLVARGFAGLYVDAWSAPALALAIAQKRTRNTPEFLRYMGLFPSFRAPVERRMSAIARESLHAYNSEKAAYLNQLIDAITMIWGFGLEGFSRRKTKSEKGGEGIPDAMQLPQASPRHRMPRLPSRQPVKPTRGTSRSNRAIPKKK